MNIIDLKPDHKHLIHQAAHLLQENFTHAWQTEAEALAEVHETLADDRISRVLLDDAGDLAGWIAAVPQYERSVWELHPLVVRRSDHRKGYGRILVEDLEKQVADRNGLTLYLGTDDEDDCTSLSGADLYTNLWQKLATIRALKSHPFRFYEKMGFQIVGVIPDANGLGKPDILMAKRVDAAGSRT